MLPAISKGNESAFECLEKAHIETNDSVLPIEFSLGKLFNAIWLWGQNNGVTLPEGRNYNLEFNYFWSLLTNPWPITDLEQSGLAIKVKKTTGAKEGHVYELSNT